VIIPNHLVECDTSSNDRRVLRKVRHVGVHLLVHQPECERLVTNKSLVVTLRVCDALFAVTPVGERVYNIAHVPFVIRLVLQEFDPHIGDCHRKAIIKANATFGDRNAEKWHARDILRDGDAIRVQSMHGVVGLVGVLLVLHTHHFLKRKGYPPA
jgi:hypothetical protein